MPKLSQRPSSETTERGLRPCMDCWRLIRWEGDLCWECDAATKKADLQAAKRARPK